MSPAAGGLQLSKKSAFAQSMESLQRQAGLTCKGVNFVQHASAACIPVSHEFGQTPDAVATHFWLAAV